MNEYLMAFQDMIKSVERLMTDEQNSLEIKQSAESLKESVHPCIEELKQSAARLKPLVVVCSDNLYQAEKVWLSKPRIAEAAKQDIWEQLGEISGHSFKIRLLRKALKSQAVEQVTQSWNKRVDNLRKKWFVDVKNGKPKDLAAWDKDKFIQDIYFQLDLQSQELSVMIKERIEVLYQELEAINRETIQNCVSLLDQSNQSIFNAQLNQTVSEIEAKFSNSTEYIAFKNKKLTNAVNPALETLVSQGFLIPGLQGAIRQGILPINWQSFAQFSAQVVSAIENIITTIFDDRIQLATQALEQAIAFYNEFLERQERYQQETPEQREAEKAWIDQQRQQLEQVQRGIEAILNAS
ncbi:MAG: hypothetical protein AB1589_22985 [Cyanobacteriota bacterium]